MWGSSPSVPVMGLDMGLLGVCGVLVLVSLL